MLGIVRGEAGWHTYYLRRHGHGAPLPRLAELLEGALGYALARLPVLLGKPWRRLTALRRLMALRRQRA